MYVHVQEEECYLHDSLFEGGSIDDWKKDSTNLAQNFILKYLKSLSNCLKAYSLSLKNTMKSCYIHYTVIFVYLLLQLCMDANFN